MIETLTETVYTFCIQKLYNMYIIDVYKMYTKCIATKCIPHFDKLLYTFCIQIKRTTPAKFYIKNGYKNLW